MKCDKFYTFTCIFMTFYFQFVYKGITSLSRQLQIYSSYRKRQLTFIALKNLFELLKM